MLHGGEMNGGTLSGDKFVVGKDDATITQTSDKQLRLKPAHIPQAAHHPQNAGQQ